MDVRFINPFIRACHHVFDRHLAMKVTVGKPHMKAFSRGSDSRFQVTIAVDLTGSVRGRVKLYFSESVSLALASGLSGMTHLRVNEATHDALREIANIIIGTAKREFPGQLTRISSPQIISSHIDDWRNDGRVLVVPLRSMAGEMKIEVKIQSVADKAIPAKLPGGPETHEAEIETMVAKLLAARQDEPAMA